MASPFDRQPARPPNSPRALALVGVLSLVLVGAIVYALHSRTPRQAAAALPAGGPASLAAGPQESPAQIMAALAHDPTADLLRGRDDRLSGLTTPPRDPFVLAPAWRDKLVVHDAAKLLPVVTPAPEAPVEYDAGQIKLQGIFKDGRRIAAIVNGTVVSAGMIVAGARIVEVRDDGLVCQPVGQPESAQFRISLNPKADALKH